MIKLCLDAGHGKSTPGKRSPDGKLLEYKFNREMLKLILIELEKYKDKIEVITTQDPDNDYDLSLLGRCKVANQNKADYFISIHANGFYFKDSNGNYIEKYNSIKGFETHIISKGGKAEQLAKQINYSVKNSIPYIVDRGIFVSNFSVLRNTNMPAILIECGFYTNDEECKLLSSEAHKSSLSHSIVNGILNYLQIQIKPAEENMEKIYKVQVGSFKEYKNANRLKEELKNKGYDVYIVEEEV